MNIDLSKYMEGAFQEIVNKGIEDVTRNLQDPNTDFKKARKLTITLNFSTTEDRELTTVSADYKTTLAPKKPVSTIMMIGTDTKGKVLATEINKQVPGQTYMVVDEETGELLGDFQEATEKILKEETAQDENLKGLKVVNFNK